ncbi:leucine-rich repeat transmembrane protein FLRT1 [Engraulis encrasicolus]|uniref:leucine-rich repeat transmembrane protein FLRT1 n=1 Tax=Engraulis encrasicolus TaxID=184585 RepID=UPI002FD1C843
MPLDGLSEPRDWLFSLLLCLAAMAEVLDWTMVAAAQGVGAGVGVGAGDSAEDPFCPSVCRCDEDFIYCNDRGLSAIPPLPPSATVLYLQNNHIDNAGLPKSLEQLTTVRVIYLYDNELDNFPTQLPPSLRELHLQDNNIRVLPRTALAKLPLLEKLHLDDNSVSTVSIEDQAFVDNPRLRLLFLSRNHLSSIPSGLPAALEELRLDDNRISTIPTHAFRGLSSLRRLVLDGNLLANQRIADDTFARLGNLTELSLVRNSLQKPPVNLPSAHLQRLSLQDNAITHIPRGALDGMRRLQRLDVSGNNLTTLPRGLFRDLDSLAQLLVRGNPWYCNCNLRWLHDWLHARGNTITVRGLTCQGPEKVRDMALKDLSNQMEECEALAPAPAAGGGPGGGRDRAAVSGVGATSTTLSPLQGSLFTLRSRRPSLGFPDGSLDYKMGSSAVGKNLALNVKALSHESIRVTWSVAQPSSSFRLSWLRQGTSAAMGSITETLVQSDRREYLLTSLQPGSTYVICIVPLVSSNSNSNGGSRGPLAPSDDQDADNEPVCAKTETNDASQDAGPDDGQGSEQLTTLPLAGIIGGATALVSLALILAIFCWYTHRAGCLSSRDHYTRNNSRKGKQYDDYIESGTKKDTTILEIRSPGFQMTTMPPNSRPPPPLQPKPMREDYIIHTIFPPNGTGLYKPPHPMTNTTAGYGTNRGYREGGIPDLDYSYT